MVPRAGQAGRQPTDVASTLRRSLHVPSHLSLPGWARRLLPGHGLPVPKRGERPISELVFGTIDLETTGLSAKTCEILEIGLVVLRHGLPVRRFQTLVRTDRTVPSVIESLTGIREADLVGAPPEPVALARLLGVLEQEGVDVLVAHNARFDRSFLEAAWERQVIEQPLLPFLCTIRLARRLMPGRRFSLDNLADRLGLLPRPRHRALGDAELAADLFRELLRRAARRGIGSLEGLQSLQSMPRPFRARGPKPE